MSGKVTAIVLAAGESRRMGRQKLLLEFEGATLIGRVVGAVVRSCVDEVVVVTGEHHNEVVKTVGEQDGLTFIRNPAPSRGMLSSVQCGLNAISPDTLSVAVFLGDQPRLNPDTIDFVVAAFQKSRKTIAVPVFEGKRGHPLVFDASHRDEVLTKFNEVGLRGLLHAHPENVHKVEVASETILEDVDTPEDYRRLVD